MGNSGASQLFTRQPSCALLIGCNLKLTRLRPLRVCCRRIYRLRLVQFYHARVIFEVSAITCAIVCTKTKNTTIFPNFAPAAWQTLKISSVFSPPFILAFPTLPPKVACFRPSCRYCIVFLLPSPSGMMPHAVQVPCAHAQFCDLSPTYIQRYNTQHTHTQHLTQRDALFF